MAFRRFVEAEGVWWWRRKAFGGGGGRRLVVEAEDVWWWRRREFGGGGGGGRLVVEAEGVSRMNFEFRKVRTYEINVTVLTPCLLACYTVTAGDFLIPHQFEMSSDFLVKMY